MSQTWEARDPLAQQAVDALTKRKVWQRTLSVYIDVDDEWLDPDHDESHDYSWHDIKKEITAALKRLYHPHGPVKGAPTIYTDWDEPPVEEK